MKAPLLRSSIVAVRPPEFLNSGLPVRNSPDDFIRIPQNMRTRSLDEFPLSARMHNVLSTAGYRSLGELEGLRLSDLGRRRSCGKVSLLELQALLKKLRAVRIQRSTISRKL